MRAALYARIAFPTQQREPAIGSQLEALRNHAASRGMKIIEEFRDEGYGGPRLNRPGLDRVRFGRALRFDVLLTYAPDRLARDSTLLDKSWKSWHGSELDHLPGRRGADAGLSQ